MCAAFSSRAKVAGLGNVRFSSGQGVMQGSPSVLTSLWPNVRAALTLIC